MRYIRCGEDLDWHLRGLAAAHPVFEPILAVAGEVPLRWLDPGLKGLVWVVTGQQISLAAGRAIFARLEAALGTISAETLAAANDEVLRGAGYSAAKIRTLRALHAAMLADGLDLAAVARSPAPDAIAALSAIKGVGPWTAEVYLLFAAGHPDVFPAADLALQEAARLAFALDARPDTKSLRALSDPWAPRRSAAARLLWAYYRARKGGNAAGPV